MDVNYNRIKRQLLSRVYLKRGVFIIISLVILLLGIRYLFMPAFGFTKSAWKLSQIKLPVSDDRTNFLVMGVGGGSHTGADLTDTMAVVSVRSEPPDVAVITIPRDLWIQSLKAKINTMYYYGEEKQAGGGFILAKSTVSEVLGIPIHYAAKIDFSGFEKLIDVIGGVEINVLNSFEDKLYPIAGKENDPCESCRYEIIKFDAGIQSMSGSTALKFARSRNSENDEGSDFARSIRQEQVMKAVREKIIQNPLKIIELQSLARKLTLSDISPDLVPAVIKLGLGVYKTPVRTTNISTLVYNPLALVDSQWVLMPVGDDFSKISSYVKDFLKPSVQ
ncbi:MAG: LCP family protein [Candidatus Amesbacteria bacterium]|nr:LCP family protein [Candidatus Amesbacteria bacterium]